MDASRAKTRRENPAALLALMWYFATDGRGTKDMVVLPYKDRLLLFSRYLQQLVMESLGKEHDLKGNVVNQGIAVYGNKGSTDQHAYVQQLRDGREQFLRHLHRGAQGPRRKDLPRGRARRHRRRLPAGLLPRHARRAQREDRHSITITLPMFRPKTSAC
jgi:glucose-6-phosphate isomerase